MLFHFHFLSLHSKRDRMNVVCVCIYFAIASCITLIASDKTNQKPNSQFVPFGFIQSDSVVLHCSNILKLFSFGFSTGFKTFRSTINVDLSSYPPHVQRSRVKCFFFSSSLYMSLADVFRRQCVCIYTFGWLGV